HDRLAIRVVLDVDATFFRDRVLLPPPTAGARVLVGCNGARAGLAADAGVAAIVERVVWHVVLADVAPHVVVGPVGERVQLDDAAMDLVDLEGLDVGPRRRLVAAQAGDPGIKAGQRSAERLDLADAAAGLAILDAGV